MVLLHRIIQRIFKIMLNICIDGQPQPAAFHRDKLGLVALRQRVAPSIHGGQHHSVLPGKGVVVFQFQPADPGVVYVGEPQHRGQKLPLWVPALGVLIDAHAGNAVLCAEIPHGIGSFPLHPVAQKAVVGAPVVELFQQLCLVQFQNLRKLLGGKGKLILRHLPGAGAQGPAAAVGGKQRTVGAVYFAPVGGHNGVSQLLPKRPLGVPAAGA